MMRPYNLSRRYAAGEVETRSVEGEGAAALHGQPSLRYATGSERDALPSPSSLTRLDHRVKCPVACLYRDVGEVLDT